MENLLFVLLLISVFLLILGLFSPKTSLFWIKTNQTRGKSSLIYGLTSILSFVAFGEMTQNKNPDNSVYYYVESKLSFYDPYNENFTFHSWIRNSKNLRTIHETLKKYGYSKLFSDSDLNADYCSCEGVDGTVSKPCKNIIDSLLITYPDIESAPKYYKEFWLRRKKENNDTTVYDVLKEIKAELFEKQKQEIKEDIVNDTILNLIRIRTERPQTDAQALENFEYLKKIGLHNSAYNLLFERYSYYEVKWDNDILKKGLKKDTMYCCPWPIIEDDTK